MANSEAQTLDAIAGCAGRIEAMCAGLDEAAWRRPTALPAWDVHDVVAHLASLEGYLVGREEPVHEPAPAPHVRNQLGELNERMVDRRRAWSGAEVLDEFTETTALRLDELRALDEVALDLEVRSPLGGTMPQRRFLGVRLWDFFVHEMDIAEALDEGQVLDSAAARRVLDDMLMLVPRAAGRGGAAEGSVVTVTLSGDPTRSVAARVEGGRGFAADPATAGGAALHLRASPTVFLRVGSGRRDPAAAIAAGDVTVDGDAALAVRVLAAVNVVP